MSEYKERISKLIGDDAIANTIILDSTRRTQDHINIVKFYASDIFAYLKSIGEIDNANKLLLDSTTHDISKFFGDEEYGYIWINAHYNLNIDYPNKEIEEITDKAWEHHKSTNNHHPEFWDDCNDMPRYAVAHMIADWKAMEKINDNSMKIDEFWDKIGSKKYSWDKEHINWIEEFIDVVKWR